MTKFVGPAPVDAADAVTVAYLEQTLASYTPGGGGGSGSIASAYAGMWDAATAYTAGQIVTYHSSTYLAATGSTGSTPSVTGSAWTLLAGGLHLAGEYDPGTTYTLGDVVTYQGSSYVGLQVVSGAAPTDTLYWTPLALGGGGGSAATAAYRHDQVTAATVWTIPHNLGFDPGVTVISADGDTITEFPVQYLTPGASLRLSFELSLAGTAYLS